MHNVAAYLLIDASQREYFTMVLCSLYWIPFSVKVEFKVLIDKALKDLGNDYLRDSFSLCMNDTTTGVIRGGT